MLPVIYKLLLRPLTPQKYHSLGYIANVSALDAINVNILKPGLQWMLPTDTIFNPLMIERKCAHFD